MSTERKAYYNVLIVDDDQNFSKSLERALSSEFKIFIASSPEEARNLLWNADAILLDIRLDEKNDDNRDGLLLLCDFHLERPQIPIIMITAYGDMATAVEAMKQGAFDFLSKPLHLTKLKTTIHNALKHAQLIRRLSSLERDFHRIEPVELVGKGPKMQEIRKIISYIAKDGYINVLITGETGTGKELVARLVHQKGWRVDGPFMAVSLAALSPSIIERELFGHEKGAFTDAKESKSGYIDQANKGILFLDDTDLAPLEVQAKLLRFLEERTICRLGSTKPIFVDVQIITATNQNILGLVKEKRFREDLYYRINAIEIRMPPLREHPEDIPLLAEHFLKLLQRQGRTGITAISKEALQVIMQYKWPGNVRELRNSIEKASLIAGFKRHEKIELEDLPAEIVSDSKKVADKEIAVNLSEHGINIEEEKAKLELAYIESALRKSGGRKSEAWSLLGLNDRFALRRRIKHLAGFYPHLIDSFPLVKKSLSLKKIKI